VHARVSAIAVPTWFAESCAANNGQRDTHERFCRAQGGSVSFALALVRAPRFIGARVYTFRLNFRRPVSLVSLKGAATYSRARAGILTPVCAGVAKSVDEHSPGLLTQVGSAAVNGEWAEQECVARFEDHRHRSAGVVRRFRQAAIARRQVSRVVALGNHPEAAIGRCHGIDGGECLNEATASIHVSKQGRTVAAVIAVLVKTELHAVSGALDVRLIDQLID